MHRLTLNTLLNYQKYLIYTEHLPMRLKCPSILLYDSPFATYKVIENRYASNDVTPTLNTKCQKSTWYTENLPKGPKFCGTTSTTSFEHTRLPRMEFWMPSDWLWTLNCQKYPVDIEYLLRCPNFTPFRSTTVPFLELIAVLVFHIHYTKKVKDIKYP